MAFLSTALKADILAQALTLADSLAINAPKAVEQTTEAFLSRHESSITRWLAMVAPEGQPQDGQITQDEFSSLVRGLKDLENMQVLAKKVKRKKALNAFADGLIDTAIHAGLTAAFGPGGSLAAAVITNVIDEASH